MEDSTDGHAMALFGQAKWQPSGPLSKDAVATATQSFISTVQPALVIEHNLTLTATPH